MPLPDNFNTKAFDQTWGDAPEWEIVFHASKNTFIAAIELAFVDYPLNAKLRGIRIRKAYGLFATSLKSFMPIIGAEKQAVIDKCLEEMFACVMEDAKDCVLQEAEDICLNYERLLEGQNDAD